MKRKLILTINAASAKAIREIKSAMLDHHNNTARVAVFHRYALRDHRDTRAAERYAKRHGHRVVVFV